MRSSGDRLALSYILRFARIKFSKLKGSAGRCAFMVRFVMGQEESKQAFHWDMKNRHAASTSSVLIPDQSSAAKLAARVCKFLVLYIRPVEQMRMAGRLAMKASRCCSTVHITNL
jgi:hypothetical protein